MSDEARLTALFEELGESQRRLNEALAAHAVPRVWVPKMSLPPHVPDRPMPPGFPGGYRNWDAMQEHFRFLAQMSRIPDPDDDMPF